MFFLQILGTSMVPPAVKIAAATATELPGDWGIKEGKINIIIDLQVATIQDLQAAYI